MGHLFHTGNKEQENQACASHGEASEQQLGRGSDGTMEMQHGGATWRWTFCHQEA